MSSARWGRVSPWLRGILTAVAIVAVGLALRDALAEADTVPWPSIPRLLFSGLFMAGCIGVAGVVWGRLLQGPPTRVLLPGFAVAQLAKYIPGSIWQGVSQVMGAESLGVGRGRASLAFVLQLWTQLVAAVLVASVAVAVVGPTMAAVALVLAVGLALASVARPVIIRFPKLVPRILEQRIPSLQELGAAVPAQGIISGATLLGAVSILLAGAGFAVLLVDPIWSPQWIVVVSAFSAAWVAGFVLVPLPAGLGVREFVLLFLLGDMFSSAAVLTAAVVYRAVTVVSELGLVAGTMINRRYSGEGGRVR